MFITAARRSSGRVSPVISQDARSTYAANLTMALALGSSVRLTVKNFAIFAYGMNRSNDDKGRYIFIPQIRKSVR